MKNPHDYRILYSNEDASFFKKRNCSKLLELFFADGRNLIKFRDAGFEVEGIDDGVQQHHDYTSEGIKKSNLMGISTSIAPLFDATLPYATNSFDGVYGWHYINHNYKEKVLGLFKEVYRILQPKGVFSFRITKMEDFKYKMIKGQLAETISSEEEIEHGLVPEKIKILGSQTFSRFVAKESGIPHYAFYKQELVDDLETLGFKVNEIKSVLWNWHVWCEKL